jgi:hypothetical protein
VAASLFVGQILSIAVATVFRNSRRTSSASGP